MGTIEIPPDRKTGVECCLWHGQFHGWRSARFFRFGARGLQCLTCAKSQRVLQFHLPSTIGFVVFRGVPPAANNIARRLFPIRRSYQRGHWSSVLMSTADLKIPGHRFQLHSWLRLASSAFLFLFVIRELKRLSLHQGAC